ncbi:3' terminal RNA ribose 2'-O-methyltransferase Hen1 [Chitinophaga pinensis]|uniref:Small RNA 2'-O-methyltransferase n=1 Tax=Chitinophaga pinensis (strain ATCC 43595 / DSM 2588 / LMG 13176 / NBRC 15968 / NCIMB 11800 / UQM 2034) TaxID=485918 RepID=A0A979G4T9_CHIPD|nr:3' terminal RNA ribose 2'-O-methyltransferase Hen1 [Chitinophaga pinensis]ACU60751.1 Methyltransferase type 12 [Chitinophaga pinensis DSM 2588]
MLLTITTRHMPATDLGYLLHKHPAKVQDIELSKGKAHIFYPVATEQECTCAMVLDIDPVGLVRANEGPSGNNFALEQYVNDRPYVASSIMSNAISKAFASALNGKCKDKPEMVEMPMPFEVKLSVLPVNGGEQMIQRMFGPLGYTVNATQYTLDDKFPEWGHSRYFTVVLKHTVTLQSLLTHLYILIPVLDNDKHYWVNKEEVEKLLAKGKGWLDKHPERELISRRYLRHQKSLMNDAMSMLMKDDIPEELVEAEMISEPEIPTPKLHDSRLQLVCDELLSTPVRSVLDLGCGEGKLLKLLMAHQQLTHITGMDVSSRTLEVAYRRLKYYQLPDNQRKRLRLILGSLVYRDRRIEGFDAAALVEVIEHLDHERLKALEKTVFEYAKPAKVVVTTPNKEWNITFTEDTSMMRHNDHRFEWTRAEFSTWCEKISTTYGYTYVIKAIGDEAEKVGAPTQMAVFTTINN